LRNEPAPVDSLGADADLHYRTKDDQEMAYCRKDNKSIDPKRRMQIAIRKKLSYEGKTERTDLRWFEVAKEIDLI
jgi:hypothetical protein